VAGPRGPTPTPPRRRPRPQRRDRRGVVGRGEHRRAGHQHVRAGGGDRADVVELDPAVDLDVDRGAAGVVEHAPQRGDLVEHRRDERLAAEAGVDAHQQHHVDVGQHPAQRLERRRRVEHRDGPLAELADRPERAVQVGAGLDVDADAVGPGLGVVGDPAIGLLDHQVDDERAGRDLAQRRDHHRADRQVGHEVPVHHVDVDVVGAADVAGADLVAEAREVGRQDGGRDADGAHRRVLPRIAPGGAAHGDRRSRAAKKPSASWRCGQVRAGRRQ
jgi:hypothetical protein